MLTRVLAVQSASVFAIIYNNGSAPEYGTHAEEILGDAVRLPDVEIATLFDTGVVQSPSFGSSCAAA